MEFVSQLQSLNSWLSEILSQKKYVARVCIRGQTDEMVLVWASTQERQTKQG